MIDIFKLKTDELKTLVCYKDVLDSKNRFPKDFWAGNEGREKDLMSKCRVLLRYCLENLNDIEPSDLKKYNLKEIKAVLVKGKLSGMVQKVFRHDIVAVLRNTYPDEFKKRILKDWMWSKHGIWYNNKAIISAVQDMVQSEGIRRLDDIPSLNWKKRLIKHGIYNILAHFSWSIYSLFNFVYPDRFHAADFKYKAKWAVSESLDNAFHFMHKTFEKNGHSVDDILMLNSSDFRRLGLAGMLSGLFHSSTIKAKEYYLYKTLGDRKHQQIIESNIGNLIEKRRDEKITTRLKDAATDKYIYNPGSNSTLYSFLKRHAGRSGTTIEEFAFRYGYIFKISKTYSHNISKDELWNLRKNGLTYIQIARKLNSNPSTISQLCRGYFGGDPLIPRPMEEYVTIQELMKAYHVDHKTIMKLVNENGFENHATIRFRYLKKSEIEPALQEYANNSKHHSLMVGRYSTQ